VRRIRKLLGPGLCTGYGDLETALLRFLPIALPSKGACLQIPEKYKALRVLTPGLIDRAQSAGKQVHVWTVDDPADMRRLLDAGVDGLITDRTDLLREVLVERGQWS
jgi:glycerophosphoryl diester phosphodiesterase